ncbi:MAG: hypothetical protein GY716_23645 [bacterium]|nr:hypothetical protein [bacterium]
MTIAIAALVALIVIPNFSGVVQRNRHSSALRRIVSDVREARSNAVSTGWEYRVIGYDTNDSGSRSNQYRMLGRRSTSVAWPAEEVAPFSDAVRVAGAWVDIASEYHGVGLDTGANRFEVTFDPRGASPDAGTSFNPLKVTGYDGMQTKVSVSASGGIRIE